MNSDSELEAMCKEWYWPELASWKVALGTRRTTKRLQYRRSYGQCLKPGPLEYEAGVLIRWTAAFGCNLGLLWFKAPEFINKAEFLYQPDGNRIYAAVAPHRR